MRDAMLQVGRGVLALAGGWCCGAAVLAAQAAYWQGRTWWYRSRGLRWRAVLHRWDPDTELVMVPLLHLQELQQRDGRGCALKAAACVLLLLAGLACFHVAWEGAL